MIQNNNDSDPLTTASVSVNTPTSGAAAPKVNADSTKTSPPSSPALTGVKRSSARSVSGASKMSRVSHKANGPTLVEKGDLKFVITDAPSNVKMETHLKELINYKVAHVACAANEAVYDHSALIKAGIKVHNVAFPDGDPPSQEVIDKWLDLVGTAYGKIKTPVNPEYAVERLSPEERVSVHCIAGLGRAPVLVALALIEYANLEPLDAISFIRSKRRGAINTKQLKWLENYKRTRGKQAGDCCTIM